MNQHPYFLLVSYSLCCKPWSVFFSSVFSSLCQYPPLSRPLVILDRHFRKQQHRSLQVLFRRCALWIISRSLQLDQSQKYLCCLHHHLFYQELSCPKFKPILLFCHLWLSSLLLIFSKRWKFQSILLFHRFQKSEFSVLSQKNRTTLKTSILVQRLSLPLCLCFCCLRFLGPFDSNWQLCHLISKLQSCCL